jgi:hypothetical protein
MQGTRSPTQLNFLWWCLTDVGDQYEPCFQSPIWQLKFSGSPQIFGKFVHPCSTALKLNVFYLHVKILFHLMSNTQILDYVLLRLYLLRAASSHTFMCSVVQIVADRGQSHSSESVIQGGSNMTETICVQTSHSLSWSYLNHLVVCLLQNSKDRCLQFKMHKSAYTKQLQKSIMNIQIKYNV